MYRIVESSCADIATTTWLSYVPGAGDIAGAVSVPKFIVNVTERSGESDQPARVAIAFSVNVVPISTGPVYESDDAVGVEPSVV